MEIYYEQSVVGESRNKHSVLYAIFWSITVVFAVLAMICGANVLGNDPEVFSVNPPSAVGFVLCLAVALCAFFRKDHLRKEYDYILRGDVLEIFAILNHRRRKKLASLHLNQVHAVGMASSARCASLRKQRGLRLHAWSVRPGTHYVYYIEDNVRHMALLELDDQIATLIHRQLPVGVWQSIEGK